MVLHQIIKLKDRYPEQCFLFFSVFILWISGRAEVCANLVSPSQLCQREIFDQIFISLCSDLIFRL